MIDQGIHHDSVGDLVDEAAVLERFASIRLLPDAEAWLQAEG